MDPVEHKGLRVGGEEVVAEACKRVRRKDAHNRVDCARKVGRHLVPRHILPDLLALRRAQLQVPLFHAVPL